MFGAGAAIFHGCRLLPDRGRDTKHRHVLSRRRPFLLGNLLGLVANTAAMLLTGPIFFFVSMSYSNCSSFRAGFL